MAELPLDLARHHIKNSNYQELFIEALGWSFPDSEEPAKELPFQLEPIARQGPVTVYEGVAETFPTEEDLEELFSSEDGPSLVVLRNPSGDQSVWWVNFNGQTFHYSRGQDSDGVLQYLEGAISKVGNADPLRYPALANQGMQLRQKLTAQQIIQRFVPDLNEAFGQLVSQIRGIPNIHDRRWYASVILNRVFVLRILRAQGWLSSDEDYFASQLDMWSSQGEDLFFTSFFLPLTQFIGTPVPKRSNADRENFGDLPFVNFDLLLAHQLEQTYDNINIPDVVFGNLESFFSQWQWESDHAASSDTISPRLLGFALETLDNRRSLSGVYYTSQEIVGYMCERTVYQLILNQMIERDPTLGSASSIGELFWMLDAAQCAQLAWDVLPNLKLLDPACGSGSFLVELLHTLLSIYEAVFCRIHSIDDPQLQYWLDNLGEESSGQTLYAMRQIIQHNLFGVDILPAAIETTQTRLVLEFIGSAQLPDDLAFIPNMANTIMCGNSLVGSVGPLTDLEYVANAKKLVDLKDAYRNLEDINEQNGSQDLSQQIDEMRASQQQRLNQSLLEELQQFRKAIDLVTWNADTKRIDRKRVRHSPENIGDVVNIESLQPFHWSAEFYDVVIQRGGFDAIATNLPWERATADEPYFLEWNLGLDLSQARSKAKRQELISQLSPSDCRAFLEYLNNTSHQSTYFRYAPQYRQNQAGGMGQINKYQLFLEQCFNLLRDGGYCATIVPAGLAFDRGSSGIWRMLLDYTSILGFFGFENRHQVLAQVHPVFQFVVLSFRKGGQTESFPAAFMKHDIAELLQFPEKGAVQIPIGLSRQLDPENLSLIPLHSEMDIQIMQKLAQFTHLERYLEAMGVDVNPREVDITHNQHLLLTESSQNALPVYESRGIEPFRVVPETVRYWYPVQYSSSGQQESSEEEQIENSDFALAIRKITSATARRTLIAAALPHRSTGSNHTIVLRGGLTENQLALLGLLNSFVADYFIRNRVGGPTLPLDYLKKLPVPVLDEQDPRFSSLLSFVMAILSDDPIYKALIEELAHEGYERFRSNSPERNEAIAAIDAIVAHSYGLTEEEFKHILGTFPLVPEQDLNKALETYRAFTPDPEILPLIAAGETRNVEFKRVDNQDKIYQAVAAFMNSDDGGTVLVGVADDGTVTGIEPALTKNMPDWDAFSLAVQNTLRDDLSIDNPFKYYRLSAHQIEDKTVCRITVTNTPEPVLLKEELFVRGAHAQTLQLQGSEMIAYIRDYYFEMDETSIPIENSHADDGRVTGSHSTGTR